MCAIAGVLNLPVDNQIRENMIATMLRRGPDGSGIYYGEGCSLLHCRLAIIDPSGGAQPMELQWGGERYILVYNGELYNAPELRRELSALGHEFIGHSDTEVVLHSYAQWGHQCTDCFNGIFAMAVWEEKSRRLFLARDRIGVKPLFYCLHEGGVIFASEIKTILAYPSVPRKLDAEGAAQIVLLGPGRISGSGVFHGIKEIEPGCRAYYCDRKMTVDRYWKLRDGEHRHSFEETVAYVRYLVTDAIQRQTVSDVPVGCFLSGGLDSSIITAICAEKMPGIDVFSLDYQDNDRYFVPGKFQPNSDNSFIRLMTDHFDCQPHWTVLTPENVAHLLEDATKARDLPGMADVDFSLLALCGDIRRHVKVALSGECADEIFGGYPWFRDPAVRDVQGFPWAQNTQERIALMHPGLRSRLDGASYVEDLYQQTLNEADILPGISPLEKRMKEMVNLNFRWFMQTLLDRKDRMSMYRGLEVRVPFCDHRIAEYLYTVPWEYKDYLGREKGLLRKAVENLLPGEILRRKKSPYPKTHHPAYKMLMRRRLETILEDPNAPVFALFDREAVRRLLTKEPQWPWYGQLMTQPQTFAYLVQVNYWLEQYKISLV